MNNHIKIIILTIMFFLNLVKMDDIENSEETNSNELLQKVLTLKESNKQLEAEIENLNKGMDQQAEIIYYNKPNSMEENENVDINGSPTNKGKEIEQFFNSFNTKLINFEKSLQNSSTDSVLLNKTHLIAFVGETFKKCFPDKSFDNSDNHVLQQLQQKSDRMDLLQKKLNNLKNDEEVLEKSFENLQQMMGEVNFLLDGQNDQFELLKKQLPIMQDSSRTLDEFVIRRNQHLDFHYKCRNENCHHRGNYFEKFSP